MPVINVLRVNLWHDLMQVRYKRLEKGTFVEFQPLSRGFHEAVGEDVKQVGERLPIRSLVIQGCCYFKSCFFITASSVPFLVYALKHMLCVGFGM